jgi:hypothetical protein
MRNENKVGSQNENRTTISDRIRACSIFEGVAHDQSQAERKARAARAKTKGTANLEQETDREK